MEKKDSKTEIVKKDFLVFGKIPLIALIFPPIGFAMLVNYILNKSR